MFKRVISIILMSSLLFLFSGCNIRIDSNGVEVNGEEIFDRESDQNVQIVDMIKDEYHESKEGVNKFNLNLDVGVSSLEVDGESDELIDAEFNYNVEKYKPECDVKQNADTKTVTIKQPKVHKDFSWGKIKNDYSINLAKEVPTFINAELGVGETKMDLSKIDLRELEIKMGVGNLNLDINGQYDNELDVDIEGGVGEFDLDLSGTFKKDVDVSIESGVGASEIIIPKDVGVRIEVDKGLGAVNINGLLSSSLNGEKIYKNSLYDDSQVKVNIHIETGLGSVEIK